MNTANNFNATEFCSSKLWELVSDENNQAARQAELKAAIAELAQRRHYLTELEKLGVFGERNS